MVSLIAFDLDGTLADTIPLCIRAFRDSVSPYAGHELDEAEILGLFGLNEIGMIKAVAGENWQSALKDFYQEYRRLHQNVTRPFSGVSDLLDFLRKKGILVALITGKAEKSCMITLQMLGLTKYFDDILCGSEKAPVKKERIEYLLDKYNLTKQEICYIGDAPGDVRACREAGVTCLSAAWQDHSPDTELEQENPGCVFYRVSDLHDYLEKVILS